VVQNGGYSVTNTQKLKSVNPLLTLTFHKQFIKEHKQEIGLIVKAYNYAVDYINKNANKDAQRFLNYIPTQNEIPDSIIHIPLFQQAILPTDSIITTVKTWAKGRSLIKNDFPNGALIDSSFIKQ
jgi:ABC-type nitrate/sulfonate/bicarbonate transport system substrate-binding protein